VLMNTLKEFVDENKSFLESSPAVPFLVLSEKSPALENDVLAKSGKKVGDNSYFLSYIDIKGIKDEVDSSDFGKLTIGKAVFEEGKHGGKAVLEFRAGTTPEETLEILKYVSNFLRKAIGHGMAAKEMRDGNIYVSIAGVKPEAFDKLAELKGLKRISFQN